MITSLILFRFLQADSITSDNAAILACLNDQMVGKDSKCQGISSDLSSAMFVSDGNPGQRFTLQSHKHSNERAAPWKYDSAETQASFNKWVVSKIVMPFQSWSVKFVPPAIPNYPSASIRINRAVEGLFDNFTRISIGLNYSTGRVTSVSFEGRGELLHETESITDKIVFDQIKADGLDYEIVSDWIQWDGLAKNRRAVLTSAGKYVLAKVRIVVVKRNAEPMVYRFRMDGTAIRLGE